eukprot:GHRR01012354.1.p1 GENE.GHRR01012354.1~~GHRR01012354.1.p1  ORF type:complete len:191 (-),score=52.35 GHRR01012354.1:1936-2508(-)
MVVLDAGSTGTRVHVFQYAAQGKSSYAIIKLPELKLKVEPGLSSYANNAAGAGMSLQPLLQFAQHHVPAGQRISTPIYLMATAGMRLLPAVAAESIMAHCRDSLSVSGFLFEPEWASIISGRSEGLYAWVAANYAAGNLQVGRLQVCCVRARLSTSDSAGNCIGNCQAACKLAICTFAWHGSLLTRLSGR